MSKNKNTTTDHTPIPWRIDPFSDDQTTAITGPGEDDHVCGIHHDDGPTALTKANAAFILTACNVHDDAVAACQAWVEYFDELQSQNPGDPLAEARELYHGKRIAACRKVVKRAKGGS